MTQELASLPEYKATMERLEGLKHVSSQGSEYWLGREVHPVLGYPIWSNFQPVIDRAKASLVSSSIDPTHHFAETGKMVELGSGSQRRVVDFYLSRLACYLLAMNGDPLKPEIAAAQAYFTIQTRRQEVAGELSYDEKRLQLRDKVKQSFKRVSSAAQDAGVRSHMQGVFHDARVQGLYGLGLKDLKSTRGIKDGEQLFDRAGPLELSANDFQMNLAVDIIRKDKIQGEQSAIRKNREVAIHVRKTIKDSGGTMPERLPLEPPIKEIVKRVGAQKKPS